MHRITDQFCFHVLTYLFSLRIDDSLTDSQRTLSISNYSKHRKYLIFLDSSIFFLLEVIGQGLDKVLKTVSEFAAALSSKGKHLLMAYNFHFRHHPSNLGQLFSDFLSLWFLCKTKKAL